MQTRNWLIFALIALLAVALEACRGASQDPLEGTSWQLVAYGQASVIPGTSVTLSFQDGQAGGSAGCNSYGGAYQVAGDKITFDSLVSTLMACTEPPGVMEQETAFLQFLQAGERFQLQDGRLLIFTADGEALTFETQD